MEITTVYFTAPNREEALSITRQLLNERLVACANILDSMTSIYRWEGEIHQEPEAAVLLKTRVPLVNDVTTRIRELHSYSLPCVVAWRSIGGSEPYFQWVHAETENDRPRNV